MKNPTECKTRLNVKPTVREIDWNSVADKPANCLLAGYLLLAFENTSIELGDGTGLLRWIKLLPRRIVIKSLRHILGLMQHAEPEANAIMLLLMGLLEGPPPSNPHAIKRARIEGTTLLDKYMDEFMHTIYYTRMDTMTDSEHHECLMGTLDEILRVENKKKHYSVLFEADVSRVITSYRRAGRFVARWHLEKQRRQEKELQRIRSEQLRTAGRSLFSTR